MGVDVPTCTLLHFLHDLKAAKLNVLRCLFLELMLYEFELSYNAAEGEGEVDHHTVSR